MVPYPNAAAAFARDGDARWLRAGWLPPCDHVPGTMALAHASNPFDADEEAALPRGTWSDLGALHAERVRERDAVREADDGTDEAAQRVIAATLAIVEVVNIARSTFSRRAHDLTLEAVDFHPDVAPAVADGYEPSGPEPLRSAQTYALIGVLADFDPELPRSVLNFANLAHDLRRSVRDLVAEQQAAEWQRAAAEQQAAAIAHMKAREQQQRVRLDPGAEARERQRVERDRAAADERARQDLAAGGATA